VQYELAEINIATFRLPMADPVNAEFIANLDRVNALAEAAPGFVWRLTGEGNDALEIHAFDNPNTAINMSVWRDMDALADFVYRNEGHREIMARRKEWFDRMKFHLAMWWVPAGVRPTVIEGKQRLESLSRLGPSAYAFVFNKPFPPPNAISVAPRLDRCA
jgi:Domain of unknown function (DUF3291)